MTQDNLKSIFTPLLTLTIIAFIWFGPLDFDDFEILAAAFVVLLFSYYEFGKKAFTFLGFKKFRFKAHLIYAPLLASALFTIYFFILIPLVTSFTGEPIDFTIYEEFEGDLLSCLVMLIFIWISAALAEELIFRGYFMKQFIKLFGKSSLSIFVNILVFAVFFGFVHSYQGISGQVVTGIVGLALASIFYFTKYDLTFNIIVHGCFDTIAIVIIYMGWF